MRFGAALPELFLCRLNMTHHVRCSISVALAADLVHWLAAIVADLCVHSLSGTPSVHMVQWLGFNHTGVVAQLQRDCTCRALA